MRDAKEDSDRSVREWLRHALTVAPSRMVAPMPTRVLSSTVAAWMMAPCPADTQSTSLSPDYFLDDLACPDKATIWSA